MSPETMLANIPSPDAVPMAAPPMVFHALLLLTAALHLLAMNLLLGGVLLAIVTRVLARRRGEIYLRLARAIETVLPVCVAATVTLGVAPLLFLQVLYGRLFYVSSILLGWWWLAIFAVVIAAYYGAYVLAARRAGLRTLIGIAVALLSVGAMLSLNMSLMLWPSQFAARYFADPAGLRPDIIDASNLARWLHFVVAAMAVAGLVLAAWGWRGRERQPELAHVATRLGLMSFSIASAINALVGLTWLGLLPSFALEALTGGNTTATVALFVAASLGIAAIWIGFVLATRRSDRIHGIDLARAASVLLLTVLAMVWLRDRLRDVMLAPAAYTWPSVAPQWDVMAVFAVCLVAAVGLVAWMARAFFAAVPGIRHDEGESARRQRDAVIQA